MGRRLGERNVVGARMNGEKDGRLPHDVPVLEKDSRECAAYLRAQLNVRDRRKLTKETQPSIKVLHQWLAHYDLRKCSRRSTGRTSTPARPILGPFTPND